MWTLFVCTGMLGMGQSSSSSDSCFELFNLNIYICIYFFIIYIA